MDFGQQLDLVFEADMRRDPIAERGNFVYLRVDDGVPVDERLVYQVLEVADPWYTIRDGRDNKFTKQRKDIVFHSKGWMPKEGV